MELCEYGCNKEAKYIFKNGRRCCSKHYRSCTYQATKIGKTRLGCKHSEETKKKIGMVHKGKTAWNKGKTNVYTEETLKQMSDNSKGNIPWNKGLSKELDCRLLSASIKNSDGRTAKYGKENGMYGKTHTDAIKEAQRQHNLKNKSWQGANNPWFGCDRSGENSPRFMKEKERDEWSEYTRMVRSITEQQYIKNKNIINPYNHIRGIRDYHLDHIIPIWYGFSNNIDINILSDIDNLRMVPWDENLKRNKIKLSKEEIKLLDYIIEKNIVGESS